jgi:SF-assemblin/beta giardin
MQHRRVSEQDRFDELRLQLDKVQQRLDIESEHRSDAHRDLQCQVDTELRRMSDRLSTRMEEVQSACRHGLDRLTHAVDSINAAISEERAQRKADIDHVGTSLCSRLDEVVQALDDERFARLEQERQSLRRCAVLQGMSCMSHMPLMFININGAPLKQMP